MASCLIHTGDESVTVSGAAVRALELPQTEKSA